MDTRRGSRFVPVTWPTLLVGAAAVLGIILPLNYSLELEYAISLAVWAVATNLLIGYGGLVSFGQGIFYGLGAYVIALNWVHHGLSFWEALAIAPLLGAVLAVGIGLIALRTRKLYFALLTLAFSQLAYTIVLERYGFTEGNNGIFGRGMIPKWLQNPHAGFYFILGLSVVSLVVMWWITQSSFGFVLQAVRDNRERAEALGVNVFRQQLLAFAISGFFCALAGTLLVVYNQSASPGLLLWTSSGIPVFMIVIGGMRKYLGPLLGALVYEIAHRYLIQHTQQWQLILGVVLLVIVVLRPEGLAGTFDGLRRHVTNRQSGHSDATAATHDVKELVS